jgi:hypothetical protein
MASVGGYTIARVGTDVGVAGLATAVATVADGCAAVARDFGPPPLLAQPPTMSASSASAIDEHDAVLGGQECMPPAYAGAGRGAGTDRGAADSRSSAGVHDQVRAREPSTLRCAARAGGASHRSRAAARGPHGRRRPRDGAFSDCFPNSPLRSRGRIWRRQHQRNGASCPRRDENTLTVDLERS